MMKPNGKYVFSLIFHPVCGPLPKQKIFCIMPGDLDHVIILTSSTQCLTDMTEVHSTGLDMYDTSSER